MKKFISIFLLCTTCISFYGCQEVVTPEVPNVICCSSCCGSTDTQVTTQSPETEPVTEAVTEHVQEETTVAAEPPSNEPEDSVVITPTIVEVLISSIGRVTTESGELIKQIRQQYDALSLEDKARVSNLNALTKAEYAYNFIKKMADSDFKDFFTITDFSATQSSKYEYYKIVSDEVFVNIQYKNLNEKTIDSIHFRVKGYDAQGNCVTSGGTEQVALKDDDDIYHWEDGVEKTLDKWDKESYTKYTFGRGQWIGYWGTEAVTFKIVYIAIDYKDGTEIALTEKQCEKLIGTATKT